MRRILFGLIITAGLCSAQEKLAPYYPTPASVVDRMLKLAKLQQGEKLFDLGSGDGRIVIAAAKSGADATGIEIDKDLVKKSSEAIRNQGLQARARIIQGDILAQKLSDADVVTIYLMPDAMEKLGPLLDRSLHPGARIVSHDYALRGWTPAATDRIADDGEGRSHILYLYVKK